VGLLRSRTVFADRDEAGRLLAVRLVDRLGLPGRTGSDDAGRPASSAHGFVVLALPRGGVPVAAPFARAARADFDVLVARKIGAPAQPEFGVGALAEDGPVVWDQETLDDLGLSEADLAATVSSERLEAGRRAALYRGDRPPPDVAGRDVVVIDDGLATGITAMAAVRWVKRGSPSAVTLAVPVGSVSAVQALRREVDRVVCLSVPRPFGAVARFYRDFTQVSDDEVLALLAASRS
jgi:putative phosphoribosyl transferase